MDPRKSQTELLLDAYQVRPCAVCRGIGPCLHREPEVELAYLAAERIATRKPPGREQYLLVLKKGVNHA
jgi:hypothetical protein